MCQTTLRLALSYQKTARKKRVIDGSPFRSMTSMIGIWSSIKGVINIRKHRTIVTMIKIKRSDWENILSHCSDENPIEACGILAGTIKTSNGDQIKEVLKVYHCKNVLNSPTEYRIGAEEQFKIFSEIDAVELDLLGFYHSHVSHQHISSKPSSIDRDRANYVGYSYMIVTLHPTKVSSWILEKKGVFKKEEICIL